jgi:phage terminase small subunit
MSGITPKQAIFAAEYLIDGNATRAAIASGFSEASAHVTGARLLRNAKVAAAIADGQARRAQKLEITAERVLRELAKLAFYDPGELFDERGNLLPVQRLDETARAAITALDTETREVNGARTVVKKVKLADKGLNLERLGRYLKLFTDRVEHDGRVTLEQLVCGGDGEESGEPAHC